MKIRRDLSLLFGGTYSSDNSGLKLLESLRHYAEYLCDLFPCLFGCDVLAMANEKKLRSLYRNARIETCRITRAWSGLAGE